MNTQNMTIPETPPSPEIRKVSIPAALDKELITMRRDPREFTVLSVGRCKFCPPKSQTAYELSHANNPTNAGLWCATHGWLSFDSVKIRPRGEEYIPKPKKRKAA